MKSAFVHYEERVGIIFDRIKPGFRILREEFDLLAPPNPYWDGNN
jgi:hypothetical protein